MTWKGRPLKSYKIGKGDVFSEGGFNEMDTCINKMRRFPHEWYNAPRWSRVITMAVTNIDAKLNWLALNEDDE
jgi:hypothetical protein